MKPLWVVVILGVTLLLGYTLFRQTAINRLDNELRALRDKVVRQQNLRQDTEKHSRLLAAEIGIAAFVESLHACARQAGITDHEVTTSQRLDPAQVRRVRRNPGPGAGTELKIRRLQVVLRSDYRSIAEYLRQVDEIGQPTQINRFEMVAEGPLIRMLLLIDLYSLKGLDANVQ